ncbi:MAG: YCF48-related protein [Candidatus Moranbacteria bacterium]|nr:YCF48-related protein [Candidatus Moranbacteria bacterium]
MKKFIALSFLVISLFFLSGCSLTGNSSPSSASILKSTDGGKIWEPKVKISEEKNISSVEILSIAIDPANSQIVYIGTRENGIYLSQNGGENWEKINFPPGKVYGLAIDRSNTQVLYALGVWQKRGKIYKSEDAGGNWKEIYTEPADGTVIISLSINPANFQVLYASTSEGAIFKTENGGETWLNLFKVQGAVTQSVFDSADGNIVYFSVLEQGILRTKNGGESFENLEKNLQSSAEIGSNRVFSLASDPQRSGTLYAGLDEGIAKSTDFGETWTPLNVLESSKNFPVRAMTINPQNSQELIYSAAQAVYKSIDGGVQWFTIQLETAKISSVIQYDPLNPGIIYLGLKKDN